MLADLVVRTDTLMNIAEFSPQKLPRDIPEYDSVQL